MVNPVETCDVYKDITAIDMGRKKTAIYDVLVLEANEPVRTIEAVNLIKFFKELGD